MVYNEDVRMFHGNREQLVRDVTCSKPGTTTVIQWKSTHCAEENSHSVCVWESK